MAEYKEAYDVMTLAEAAEFIRVSEKTLGEMARDHRVPCRKVGREWRFLRHALEEWLAGSSSSNTTSEEEGPRRTSGDSRVGEPLVQYQISFPGFRDTAFRENHERALHRWVPWIAGFSSAFVDEVLERTLAERQEGACILDPFAGVGTTLVEGIKHGCNVVGFEINPYAALACRVKVNAASYDVGVFLERIVSFREHIEVQQIHGAEEPLSRPPNGFVSRVPFFSPDVERQVLFALDFIRAETVPWIRDLFQVALGSVMVGFSNYSYEPSLGTRVAAGKPNIETADVGGTIADKLQEMADDVSFFQDTMSKLRRKPTSRMFADSYFDCSSKLARESVDVLITSPPYLNNYHYVRNTRPQMFWLGMVKLASDLKEFERKSFGQFWQTVRSGPTVKLVPKIEEMEALIETLRNRNSEKGPYGGPGWANYAASYFNDCARFCAITRDLIRPGGTAVVVIGNNILQGIEFRTDRFFGQIAEQSGFEIVDFHEVRKKRTGSSIVNSSVRVGTVPTRVQLYETAVEMRVPPVRTQTFRSIPQRLRKSPARTTHLPKVVRGE